jgi:hypothetical protein
MDLTPPFGGLAASMPLRRFVCEKKIDTGRKI